MKHRRWLAFLVVSLALVLSACGGSPLSAPLQAEPSAAARATATPLPTLTAIVKGAEAGPAGVTGTCADVPAGELGVAYVSGYQDLMEAWMVVGLVCNNTSGAVANIELAVELFDQAGQSLYKKDQVYTALEKVGPGEASPFSLGIFENLAAPATVKAEITSSTDVDLRRAALDTRGVLTTVDANGNLHITGELVNPGAAPVKVNSLAGAIFDGTGRLVAADYASVLIRYLAPGGSGPFRITMYGTKEQVTRIEAYQLYFDAETTEPQAFLIDAERDLAPLTSYQDSYGQFHLVGEITNNGSQNIGARLLATIYDETGNVVDASSVDTAISAIRSGETIPYEFNYWGPLDSQGQDTAQAARFTVQVDPTWTWTTDAELLELATRNDANTWDENQGTFSGEVVNDSGQAVESAVVMVAIWSKAGQPTAGQLAATGHAYAEIKDQLAAGEAAAYTVFVPVFAGFNIDNYEYKIVVKARRP